MGGDGDDGSRLNNKAKIPSKIAKLNVNKNTSRTRACVVKTMESNEIEWGETSERASEQESEGMVGERIDQIKKISNRCVDLLM